MKNKDNSLNDLSINLVEKIDEITVNFRYNLKTFIFL